jgi:putative effector of murein hydrolase LrgA (UPF0299 family)
MFRRLGSLTVNIATLAPRPVKDIRARWVTRLLTLLLGSLGILTVSSTIAIMNVSRSSEANTTLTRLEIW